MTRSLSENPVEGAPPPLRGHRHLLDRIATSLSESRLHHAWLMTGPEGIGKFKTALHIAAWLLSLPKPSDGGLFSGTTPLSLQHPDQLDFNHPDARLAFAQTHPDMLILAAGEDDKNKSGQIKTDQIRELKHFFAHSAGRAGRRIAIIDSLDLVNRNGQNAMLKILEEPPQSSVLLVLSNQQGESYLQLDHDACMQRCADLKKGTPKVFFNICGQKGMKTISDYCPDYVTVRRDRQCALQRLTSFPCLRPAATYWLMMQPADKIYGRLLKSGELGQKSRSVRMTGLYLFEAIISRASLSAAGVR